MAQGEIELRSNPSAAGLNPCVAKLQACSQKSNWFIIELSLQGYPGVPYDLHNLSPHPVKGYWSCACVLNCFRRVRLFVTPWTIALQASLSVGFSRQEYWSGLPRPPPEDIPDPGIKPRSLMLPASAGRFFTTSATWEALKWSHSVVSNSATPGL